MTIRQRRDELHSQLSCFPSPLALLLLQVIAAERRGDYLGKTVQVRVAVMPCQWWRSRFSWHACIVAICCIIWP